MSRAVFEYALVRVVPRPERGERVNAGVIVYCQRLGFLGAWCELDVDRVLAVDSGVDVVGVSRALEGVRQACRGEDGVGAASEEDAGRRFRWLTSPRSTVVQPGPVHSGLTLDPAGELERLARLLVR